ncbi:MAG: 2OG-Fe(II) oxygenase [Gemmataceae bacterium]|nr:2OG-Fe(II) oxygenase [Gemmataceae bacterium]
MSDKFHKDLQRILAGIDRPGTFAVSGSAPAFLPGLEVEGVGTVAFPLVPAQAKEIKARCEQAPYGKGEETLVDTKVRKVWRLKPEKFALGPAWTLFVKKTVEGVQEALGLEKQKLEASLYELLLYEKGGFFLPHRDGEKADRTVATLVFVLPSSFEGGELVVRHEGREVVIDHSAEAGSAICHAAFYADCEHEIKPLRKGHRLCLVYNLALAKSKKRLLAPTLGPAIEQAAEALAAWAADEDAGKVVVPLGHQYTEAGAAWDALKGTDRPKAQVLLEAARRAGCRAYLALLTFHESGSAEYAGSGGGGYGRHRYWEEEDGSDYEMDEVFDSDLAATRWLDPEGGAFPLKEVGIEIQEVLGGEDALRGIDPETQFEGYTGNEGMTLDHWYRHAAVILWPGRLHFDMVAQAGCRPAAEVLADMAQRWEAAGKP